MKVSWTKAEDGWRIYGAEKDLIEGATVQVTRRDGSTSDVVVGPVRRERKSMIPGVWMVSALPVKPEPVPAPAAPVVQPAPVAHAAASQPAQPTAAQPVDESRLATPKVFNGRHTLTRGGEHYTFKVSTSQGRGKIAKGMRILSILDGPDNENDYRGIGFIDEAGVHLWSRWRGSAFEGIARTFWSVMTEGDRNGWEVLTAGSCVCCNRSLTTPESIRSGIGPVCADRGSGGNDKATLRKLRRLRRLQAQAAALEATE